MAKLVSDRTAQALTELLAGRGRQGVSAPIDPRDLTGGATGYKALFDIYDRTLDSFKVRGKINSFLDFKGVANYIGGQNITITAGTGGKKLDEEITVTATDKLVYLLVTMAATPTVTLNVIDPSTWPTGTDTTEPFPLWYIDWDNTLGRIIWENCIDLRYTLHITQMSG